MSLIKRVGSVFKTIVTLLEPKNEKISDAIPAVPSLPVIGKLLIFFRTRRGTMLHEYIDARHKQLGPIFKERLDGKTELVFISDPVLMKSLFINHEGKHPMHILPEPWVLYEKIKGSNRGLFFMNGDEWLANRRIINKYLLKEDSEKWLESSINEAVCDLVANWRNKTKNRSPYIVHDVESELYKFSINVIINVLLGEKSIPFGKHYNELMTRFSDSVKRIFQTTTALYGLPLNMCQKYNLKIWRDFETSVDQSLLLAKTLVSEILEKKIGKNGLIHKLVSENISKETITRIVSDFIIAAGDTTAYTTLWIFILLSKNNDVVAEIQNKDKSYIKLVVKEAMRMYPVAPFVTRILQKETCLESYLINENTPVIASIYTSGRDEQYFSKPHLFLPYRWDRTDPRKKDIVNHTPSASLPFAFGVRSCIGKKIAMLQLTEIISQVVENFEIKCTNENDVQIPNAITSQVLIPDKSIDLVLTARN